MVSIKWCLKQKNGIELIAPNENMANSYLSMAQDSIQSLSKVKESRIWSATMAYYIFYYSLYSFMLRIGIKCEIHSCSLEFMKTYLGEFYNPKDVEMINKAFLARIDLQYYADRPIDESITIEINSYCKDFFIKTKDNLAKISEENIAEIRDKLRKKMKNQI